jgi:ECF transporter S component (folate family)
MGGYPTLSIELGGIPIVIGGIALGPLYGGIIGFASDIVGYLINNRGGAYYFGFTLNNILTGIIPGLIYIVLKKKDCNKIVSVINYVFLTMLFVFAEVYFFTYTFENLTNTLKYTFIVLILIVYLILIISLFLLNKKFKDNSKSLPISYIFLMIMIVEVFVYIALTPIWVNQLYGLPLGLSALSRVFRAMFMLPIKTILVYIILSALYASKILKD